MPTPSSFSVSAVYVWLEGVADAVHRPDDVRQSGALELGPHPAHMHVDGAFADVFVAPDPMEQTVTREDGAGIAHEVLEQVELLGLQCHLSAVGDDVTCADI